ncbi:hypothetical protein GGS23DRAFT_125339 [Durotheca rogersii]|uniref:uncharacterized protein n=1 Tax=Durotheca rogersii TaxID=419775 RepID=UPI00221E929E|nr:uncharacterized protein GGS23DRAFT_125339 [Durotheca rogersii]KAI5862052.1 hypothetical protein GGS23DRAFT_125339 [Durotheca rogersii]
MGSAPFLFLFLSLLGLSFYTHIRIAEVRVAPETKEGERRATRSNSVLRPVVKTSRDAGLGLGNKTAEQRQKRNEPRQMYRGEKDRRDLIFRGSAR